MNIRECAIFCAYEEKDTVRTIPMLKEGRLLTCGVSTPMFHVKDGSWMNVKVKFML